MANTTKDSLTGLQFREDKDQNTFDFKQAGDSRGTEIRGSLSYKTYQYNSNHEEVGTKDISFVFTQQLENGELIVNVTATTDLPGGYFHIGIDPCE